MTLDELEQHFGSQAEIARALGLERGTVWAWFYRKRIPQGRQYQIQLATKGRLKADT